MPGWNFIIFAPDGTQHKVQSLHDLNTLLKTLLEIHPEGLRVTAVRANPR